MRNGPLLLLVRNGAAGFAVALTLWLVLSAPYAQLLASLSQMLMRLTEWPTITSVVATGTLLVNHRSDVSPGSGQMAVESRDVTFNVILLMTLFAASRNALSQRNLVGLAAASGALCCVHVLAVVSFLKADYATNYGQWSAEHFGAVSHWIWTAAPYFYSVIGVHAFAFALWWLLRDHAAAQNRGGRRARGSGSN